MIKHTSYQAKIFSITLFTISILSIALMLHHPVHEQSALADQVSELNKMATQTSWVHGVLIVIVMLYSICFKWFGEVYQHNYTSRVASYIFQQGNLAMIAAALISGFIYPSLGEHFIGSTVDKLQIFEALRNFCLHSNQVLAFFGVYCWCASICLWCVDLVKPTHKLSWLFVISLLASVCTILALTTNLLTLNVTGMTIVAVELSLWSVLVSFFTFPKAQK